MRTIIMATAVTILATVALVHGAAAEYTVIQLPGDLFAEMAASLPISVGNLDTDTHMEIILRNSTAMRHFLIYDLATGMEEYFTPTQLTANITSIHIVQITEEGMCAGIVRTEDNKVWLVVDDAVASVVNSAAPAARSSVMQASPNPLCGQAKIEFSLESAQDVSLNVYDVQGRIVRELSKGHFQGGRHKVDWDGRDSAGRSLTAGEYFYRLAVDGRTVETDKVVFVR
jgi:hypothetical protein